MVSPNVRPNDNLKNEVQEVNSRLKTLAMNAISL